MTGSTKALEIEAAATRDRIAGTVDELQARLSPKALVDQALGSIGNAGTQAVASMRGAAAGHPVVLGAAGLAVGIGLLARSRVAHAKVEYGDSYAAYADYDDGYAANLADGEPEGSARAQFAAINTRAHATVDDNPLAIVAAGIVAGAVLGAVVPVSAAEASLAADLRGRLAAAGDAVIAAGKREFDVSKLSLAGGTAGIGERLTQSLIAVAIDAVRALARPVSRD
jgi:hypothetical protein